MKVEALLLVRNICFYEVEPCGETLFAEVFGL